MKEEIESHSHSDYMFKLIFLTQAVSKDWLEEYLKVNPVGDLIRKLESQSSFSFLELFEEHYKMWDEELNSTSNPFLLYIKSEIDRALKEIILNSDFEKKSLVLAGKYIKLITEERSQKYDLYIYCNEVKVTISLKSFFHVLWGHYLRLPLINIKERNKSIFTDHTNLEFVDDTRVILSELIRYKSILGSKPVYVIKYKERIRKIVLRRVDNCEYELISYYIVDRQKDLDEIKSRNSVKIDKVSIYIDKSQS